jgi:hypothetical protein
MPPIRMQSNTVLGVIVDRMNRTRAGINEILGFAPFLATELIDLFGGHSKVLTLPSLR